MEELLKKAIEEYNNESQCFIINRVLEVITELEAKNDKGDLYIRCLELLARWE